MNLNNFAAWNDGQLCVGQLDQHWNDADVSLFGGDTANHLAAQFAQGGRLVILDDSGFFTDIKDGGE